MIAQAMALRAPAKVGLVAAGYAGALVLAYAVVAIFAASHEADSQGADGMYAFGEAILFLAVFGIAATAPTGGALYFLRPYPNAWLALSAGGLAISTTAVAACLYYIVSQPAMHGDWLQAFAVTRLLLSPWIVLALIIAALVAPDRRSRGALLVSIAIEAASFGCAALLWFVSARFQ